MTDQPVILYDGTCGLCDGAVRFILKHERAPWCRFAPIQSPAGAALIRAAGRDPEKRDTVYLWTGGMLLDRSDAALEAARHLRAPWRWARMLRVLPRPWRDALYDLVARRRYRWFGRRDFCLVPPGLDRSRFLA